MSMDPITEAIAHFVGLFNLQTEASRLRADYDKFRADQAAEREDEALSNIPRDAKALHHLDDFDPKVRYQAEADPLLPPPMPPRIELPDIPPPPLEKFPLYRENAPLSQGAGGGVGAGGSAQSLRTIEPPHSLAAVIKQNIFLSDDDYLNLTDINIETLDPELALAALSRLAEKAGELDRLDHAADLSSSESIADFVWQTQESLSEIADYAEHQDSDADIFVEHADTINGIYVNGEAVTEALSLTDYLPEPFQPDEQEASDPVPQSIDMGGADGSTGEVIDDPVYNQESGAVALAEPFEEDGKTEITAGSNLVVNSASLASSWMAAPVYAVMGNSVKINVISQINVLHTADAIDDELSTWDIAGDAETEAYNIASFTSEPTTPESSNDEPEDNPIFPSSWDVTTIEGDVVFMNWVEQYNFISDNDTTIMSTSGSATISMTGGNQALNGVSLLELGNYYDVIIIDGDIVQANIISQTNVLLDSDTVWSAPGLAHSNGQGKGPGNDNGIGNANANGNGNGNGNGNNGKGNLDTDGNLLWNQAAIHTIGTQAFEAMPMKWQKAFEQLAAGGTEVPSAIYESELFAGVSGLRVLHIKGDLIDLQYVSQTNILGDADEVAVLQDDLAEGSDAEWTISTGDNALVNQASIVDAGVDATVMVAGEEYSDDLLYQANFISDEPPISSGDPLELANEAVAFLADDITANPDNPDEQPLVLDPETSSGDVMETMLS